MAQPPTSPRQYYPASTHSNSNGSMPQSTSPSLPLEDGSPSHRAQIKSDQDVPIDPTIAASSPTYPAQGGPYSGYPPQHDMSHGYPQHPGGPMYTQPRPDWGGYSQHPQHMPPPYPAAGVSNSSVPPGGARSQYMQPPHHPLSQVYSFVPIPGTQQHKRPRRRYEEIERMYKCGWNGCEKAYGTLNHLNAHVTMQSHGSKRTPEEFKEIRKEWKARKKEEDAQRKAEEDRQRAAQAQVQQPAGIAPEGHSAHPDQQPPPPGAGYPQAGRGQVQLPPIGYQPGSQVPGQYQAQAGGVQQLAEYTQNHMYSGYPASPYGQPNQMYNQHNGNGNGNGLVPKYENHSQ